MQNEAVLPLLCCLFAVLPGKEINYGFVFKQTEGACSKAYLLSTEICKKTLEKRFLKYLSQRSKCANFKLPPCKFAESINYF